MVAMLHPAQYAAAIVMGGYFRPEFGPYYRPYPSSSALARRYDLVALSKNRPPPRSDLAGDIARRSRFLRFECGVPQGSEAAVGSGRHRPPARRTPDQPLEGSPAGEPRLARRQRRGVQAVALTIDIAHSGHPSGVVEDSASRFNGRTRRSRHNRRVVMSVGCPTSRLPSAS